MSYYRDNCYEILRKVKEYYQRNRERKKEQAKKYEDNKHRMREYYERNKEELKERLRFHYQNMTDEKRKAVKEYQRNRYHTIITEFYKSKK